MSLAFSIIRCAPRRRRSKPMRLVLFLAATALAGWLLHLSLHAHNL